MFWERSSCPSHSIHLVHLVARRYSNILVSFVNECTGTRQQFVPFFVYQLVKQSISVTPVSMRLQPRQVSSKPKYLRCSEIQNALFCCNITIRKNMDATIPTPKIRVGFLGPLGSYSHEATQQRFPTSQYNIEARRDISGTRF